MNVIDHLLARGYWNEAGAEGADAGGAGAAIDDAGDIAGGDDSSIAGDEGAKPEGGEDDDAGTQSIAGGEASGEGEASGDKADGDDKGDDAKKDGDGAGSPEGGYSDFTIPEGGAPLNEELLKEFTDVASEAGLSQERAQSLIDVGYKLTAAAQDQVLQEFERDFQARQAAWSAELQKDPEFANWNESVATVRRGRAFFGGGVDSESNKELAAMLKETGLGNHPMLVRGFRRIGELIGPDGAVIGSSSSSNEAAVDGATRLYGSDPE